MKFCLVTLSQGSICTKKVHLGLTRESFIDHVRGGLYEGFPPYKEAVIFGGQKTIRTVSVSLYWNFHCILVMCNTSLSALSIAAQVVQELVTVLVRNALLYIVL